MVFQTSRYHLASEEPNGAKKEENLNSWHPKLVISEFL